MTNRGHSFLLKFLLLFVIVLFIGFSPQAFAISTTTKLAVTVSGSPITTAASGTIVTLTATVTAGTSPVTAGTVNFCDASAAHCTDAHLFGSAQLTNTGTATLKFVPAIGSHLLKAIFIGTTSNATSTSVRSSLVVTGKFPTATTLAATGSVNNYALAATVAGSGSTKSPTGTVTFVDTNHGNAILGTALLGAGTAGIARAGSSVAPSSALPLSLVTGDLNRDGIADLVVGNEGSNTLSILLGNTNGTFTVAPSPKTGQLPTSVALGDFNNDGILDIVVTNGVDGTLNLMFGKGDGTFTVKTPSSISIGLPIAVAVGDFNRDGNLDLAVAAPENQSVFIYLGDGKGNFTAKAPGAAVGKTPDSVAVGDFNGDSIPDLAVVNGGASGDNTVSILLGNGDGTFKPKSLLTTGQQPHSIITCDINGDGKIDLVLVNNTDSSVSLFFGVGDGTFSSTTLTGIADEPMAVAAGDLNDDGIVDLAITDNSQGNVVVLIGDGTGNFPPEKQYTLPAGSTPQAIVVANFAGSSQPGIAVTNLSNNLHSTVTILGLQTIATDTPTFDPPSLGPGIHTIVAQYPGNATFSGSNSNPVQLTGARFATTLSLTSGLNPAAAGAVVSLTIHLKASPAVPTGEKVTLKIDSTAATTITLDATGSAITTLSALAVGTHKIAVSFAGDVNFLASSASLAQQIFNAPAASATLTVSPATAALGTTFTLSGSAVDAQGLAIKSGNIAFYDGAFLLGSAPIVSTTGIATLKTRSLTPGINSLAARCLLADTKTTAVSKPVSVTVTGLYSSSLALTSTGSQGSYALTAAISGRGAAIPTGKVTFTDTTAKASLGVALPKIVGNGLSWSASTSAPFAAQPEQTVLADINGDGYPDQITTLGNSSTNWLRVMLAKGDGTFAAASTVTTAAASNNGGYALAVADVNADGKPDLLATSLSGTGLAVFLGKGNGTFGVEKDFPLATNFPDSLAVTDLNGDGKPDVIAGDYNNSCVRVLLGKGDGTFLPQQAYSTDGNPESVAVGDLNGDGIPDLVVANTNGGFYGSVSVLLGNGDGTFKAQTSTAVALGFTAFGTDGIALADVNSDGRLDIVVPIFNGGAIGILLGKGNGAFLPQQNVPVSTGSAPDAVVAADINRDGHIDLVVSSYGGNLATVLLGNGKGAFTAQQIPSGNGSISVAVADLNGDGLLDVAIANRLDATMSVLLAQQSYSATINGIQLPGTGNQTVSATFSADKNFGSSTSNALSLTTTP